MIMSSTPKARREKRDEDYLVEIIFQIKDHTEKCLMNGIEITERLVSFQFIDLCQYNEIF